jgi:hypothetical protein
MFIVPYILVMYIVDWKSKPDRAESVRVSQPEPAPMDYPTSHIP